MSSVSSTDKARLQRLNAIRSRWRRKWQKKESNRRSQIQQAINKGLTIRMTIQAAPAPFILLLTPESYTYPCLHGEPESFSPLLPSRNEHDEFDVKGWLAAHPHYVISDVDEQKVRDTEQKVGVEDDIADFDEPTMQLPTKKNLNMRVKKKKKSKAQTQSAMIDILKKASAAHKSEGKSKSSDGENKEHHEAVMAASGRAVTAVCRAKKRSAAAAFGNVEPRCVKRVQLGSAVKTAAMCREDAQLLPAHPDAEVDALGGTCLSFFVRLEDETSRFLQQQQDYTLRKARYEEVALPRPMPVWMAGDGNCAFRCIAFLEHGEEDRHEDVRKEICDWMSSALDSLYGRLETRLRSGSALRG